MLFYVCLALSSQQCTYGLLRSRHKKNTLLRLGKHQVLAKIADLFQSTQKQLDISAGLCIVGTKPAGDGPPSCEKWRTLVATKRPPPSPAPPDVKVSEQTYNVDVICHVWWICQPWTYLRSAEMLTANIRSGRPGWLCLWRQNTQALNPLASCERWRTSAREDVSVATVASIISNMESIFHSRKQRKTRRDIFWWTRSFWSFFCWLW